MSEDNNEVKTGYMQHLRNLREDSDKTQQEIADVLGTSQTMYSRYERGESELPIRHLRTLCEYFDTSADVVLELTPGYKRASGKTKRNR